MAAVVVFVLAIGIYLGVQPDIKDVSKDFNMSNLSKPGVRLCAAVRPRAG